jgi:hypothetical protein
MKWYVVLYNVTNNSLAQPLQVYYNKEELSLDDSVGRVEFARHLYNRLCVELDQDQDQGRAA